MGKDIPTIHSQILMEVDARREERAKNKSVENSEPKVIKLDPKVASPDG